MVFKFNSFQQNSTNQPKIWIPKDWSWMSHSISFINIKPKIRKTPIYPCLPSLNHPENCIPFGAWTNNRTTSAWFREHAIDKGEAPVSSVFSLSLCYKKKSKKCCDHSTMLLKNVLRTSVWTLESLGSSLHGWVTILKSSQASIFQTGYWLKALLIVFRFFWGGYTSRFSTLLEDLRSMFFQKKQMAGSTKLSGT